MSVEQWHAGFLRKTHRGEGQTDDPVLERPGRGKSVSRLTCIHMFSIITQWDLNPIFSFCDHQHSAADDHDEGDDGLHGR